MVILLFFSGLLSGSETAYFNLSRRQVQLLASSSSRLSNLAAFLLKKPKRLLTCLLFGNMAVNVLYFALASLSSVILAEAARPTASAAFAFGSFAAILLFGEILPKSFAYSYSQSFCISAAPFCYVIVRILSGILKVFDFVIVWPFLRFIAGPIAPEEAEPVSSDQLISLIDVSRQRGLITEDENQLFAEVIELGLLKVRHVMHPRVDMTACSELLESEEIKKIMSDNQLTKIPVYEDDVDSITGLLYLRDLILFPESSPSDLVRKVDFVPEQKTVESLLEFFRKNKTDFAVAVDEYGGIAGVIYLENIVEELVGPLEASEDITPIEQIGPLKYRLAGNLSVHDWTSVFDVNAVESKMSTIAGLTTALLGKVPAPGDKVTVKNITLTVERVNKRRIETLILTFVPQESEEQRESQGEE